MINNFGKLRGKHRYIPLERKGCDIGYPCIYAGFSSSGKFCCNYTIKPKTIKRLYQCPMGSMRYMNLCPTKLSRHDFVLSGEDAVDFIDYLKNPTYTDEANECIRQILKEEKLLPWDKSNR